MASNSNTRGSSYDRRVRRGWMVDTFGFSRSRTSARKVWIKCHWCPRTMRAAGHAWEIDRHPRCGHAGGRYVRGNIVPSCVPCNRSRCTKFCRAVGRGESIATLLRQPEVNT